MSSNPLSPKVSIIIPVYNSAAFLSDALDSVLAQTYTDFELIIINDGSTDGTCAVIDRYIDLDARIVAKTTVNQGPSNARKEGLVMARGEFVYFLDSDDTMEPGALSNMIATADRTGADMVIPRLRFRYADGSEQDSAVMPRPVMTGLDYLKEIMHNRGYWCLFVMTKRELFEDIENIPGVVSFGEDAVWKTQLLVKARAVALEDSVATCYNERQGSLSNADSFSDQKYREWLAYNRWIEDYLREKGVDGEMGEALAVMRKINLFQQIHWRRLEDVDEKMKLLIADLKAFPSIRSGLSRRERTIVAYYRLGRWFGRKFLERKLRRHGGLQPHGAS